MKGVERVNTTVDDEFQFLASQAAALGTSVAAVKRLEFTTTSGAISALRFGDAPPVVTFLHGAGLNAHTWDTTILALGLPALVLDLPGHGDSAWRDDANYSPASIGGAIAEAIEAATDTPQLLVGHSLGGLTATWVAAHRPDRVRSLVIVDITPGIDAAGGPAILRKFYEVLDFPNRKAVVDRAEAFGFGGARADTERGVFFNTRVREDGRVEWKHHFARLATAVLATPEVPTELVNAQSGWADLDAVTAPITLIRGTDGYVGEPALTEFRERVPAAVVHEVPTGHNVHENAPQLLADIIRDINAH